jgi:hypothetical protein
VYEEEGQGGKTRKIDKEGRKSRREGRQGR